MKQISKVFLCLLLILGSYPLMLEQRTHASGVVNSQLAAGYYHNVSLTSSGEVWSWGRGDYGQMGNGRTQSWTAPVKATGLNHVKAISGGVHQSYAILNDGTVWSWGSNSHGQLGDGTTTNRLLPVKVNGLNNITSVSGGTAYHALALDEEGKVWAWGDNLAGQLGNGTTDQSTEPIEVSGLEDVEIVAAGGYFSLALKSDGTVWAWGSNDHGQLGDGTTIQKDRPFQISGLSNIISIAAGGNHSLALDAEGNVWAWGDNRYGALGDGTNTSRRIPVKATAISQVKAIAGGGYHTVAVKEDGTVWSWGLNNYSQVGDGTTTWRNIPVQVPGLDDAIQAAAGGFHSAVLQSDGRVWSWGLNASGQLGNGTSVHASMPVLSRAVLDTTAPTIRNGEIMPSAVTSTGATLTWDIAEDNMTKQEDLQYLVYRSNNNNIQTVSNIERNGVPLGQYTEDIGTLDVTGLEPGTSYYFNIIVKDLVNNKSAYNSIQVRTKSTHTVTYNANGSTGGTEPVDNSIYEQGSEVTVLENLGLLERDGYMFDGWNSEADGRGTDYVPGRTFTIEADMTLYAKWMAIPDPSELTLLSFSPANQATGVSIHTDLNLSFSSNVTAVEGKSITIKKLSDDSVVEVIDAADTAKVTLSGSVVRITPEIPLDFNTSYYVEIEEFAFMDENGSGYAGMTGASTWSFTTEADQDTPLPEPDTDSNLSALSLSAGGSQLMLSPAFESETTVYSTSVRDHVYFVTVLASTVASESTVTASVYNGVHGQVWGPVYLTSGQLSDPLPLSEGRNLIELAVSTEDGSTKVYTVTINREHTPGVPPDVTPDPPLNHPTENIGDSEKAQTKSKVRINGNEASRIVTEKMTKESGRTSLTLEVDATRLDTLLEKEKMQPVISFSVTENADKVSVVLTGSMVKTLENKEATIELKTAKGSYTLPTDRLQLEKLSAKFGQNVELSSLAVHIQISKASEEQAVQLEQAANEGGFTILTPPVDFEISVTADGKTVLVDQFDSYVERELALPKGVDPQQITTAVVIEQDGSLRHVPTRIVSIDGDYVAVVSSLTNSAYSLIWNPQELEDVAGHWAEGSVNDSASRLIVQGREGGYYHPNAEITRAEFVAVMIRALGLSERGMMSTFTDVPSSAWHSGVLGRAQEYGMIQGYGDGTFRPSEAITRQEAIGILVKMAEIAGIETEVNKAEIEAILSSFKDHDQISVWANQAFAAAVRSQLLKGSDSNLRPLNNVTRAETAALVQRVLVEANLINRVDSE